MRHIISILLQNEAGALARVAAMFSSRGYNIESLTVAATHDPKVSRLTLVTLGDDAVIAQIISQSRKLIDVLEIADITSREHHESELLIVKVKANDANAARIAEFAEQHQGSVIDHSTSARILQFIGGASHIGAVLDALASVADVIELARSGTAAIECGDKALAPPA
jgi:acetolactate synthase-1/3 small subunit